MHLKPFLVGAALVLALPSVAQAQPPQEILSAAAVQEDFAMLRSVLNDAHGGLYRYSSKEEIDAQMQAIQAKLTVSMSEIEFYRLLPPLIDAIHDGHSNIRPSKEFRGYLISSERRFPFDVRYVDGKAHIEENFSGEPNIPLGARILSINSRDMDDITNTLLTAVGTDGYIETSKYYRMNRLFWLHYAELIDTGEVFNIVIEDPVSREMKHYSVEGVPASVLLDDMRAKERFENALTLEFVSDQLAIMTIETFTDMGTTEFFEGSFETLKKREIKNLIIDIRGNSGGYDKFNTDLFEYLVDRPFRFYDRFAYRIKGADALKGIQLDQDAFFFVPDIQNMTEGERRAFVASRSFTELMDSYVARNPAAGVHYPNEEFAFIGDVYLLFDGGSGSSGGEVPALMHHLGVGTLIGEEANGAYEGVTAGITAPLTLPNSGARVNVPLIAYYNAVVDDVFPGRGAPPHFPVSQTLEDALANRDTAMEFTLELIRKRNPVSSTQSSANHTTKLPDR